MYIRNFLNTCFQRSNPVTLVTPKMLKTAEPTIVPIPMSPFVTKEPKNTEKNMMYLFLILKQSLCYSKQFFTSK